MQVFVNDQPHEVADQATVSELIEQLRLTSRQVAVELNLQVVPRAEHPQRQLRPGDRLEVVTLVGGG